MQNVGYFFYCLKKRVTTFTYTSRTLGRRQTTNDIQQEERLSQRIKGIFSHKLDFFFFFSRLLNTSNKNNLEDTTTYF